MTADKKCLRCGSIRLESGKVESVSGPVHFKPDNTKFFTLSTSRVEVRANVCLDCGTVEFVADADKAQSLTAATTKPS